MANQSRTIAIGDVHGCSKALRALLKAIQPGSQDTLVMLGDYVDRGPDSKGVIQSLIELRDECQLVTLIGNHEIIMLNSGDSEPERDFWLACGGDSTLDSYGGDFDLIPPQHIEFLKGCERFYETESHFFVHANYQHDLPLEKQDDQILFWEHITHEVPEAHVNGKTAVVGHTPQVDGVVKDIGYLILLDTYCFGGEWLSALDVNHGYLWQANQSGDLHEEQTPRAANTA